MIPGGTMKTIIFTFIFALFSQSAFAIYSPGLERPIAKSSEIEIYQVSGELQLIEDISFTFSRPSWTI